MGWMVVHHALMFANVAHSLHTVDTWPVHKVAEYQTTQTSGNSREPEQHALLSVHTKTRVLSILVASFLNVVFLLRVRIAKSAVAPERQNHQGTLGNSTSHNKMGSYKNEAACYRGT